MITESVYDYVCTYYDTCLGERENTQYCIHLGVIKIFYFKYIYSYKKRALEIFFTKSHFVKTNLFSV